MLCPQTPPSEATPEAACVEDVSAPVAAMPLAPRPEPMVPLLAVADLHCHLLPAWDDGVRNLEESLSLAWRAARWGCETMLVTPHVGKSFTFELPDAALIAPAVANLEHELVSRGLKLCLVPAAEVALSSPAMVERILNEPSLRFGEGKYALVEPPTLEWPDWMEGALLPLLQNSITPLIAHPERFPRVQRRPERLALGLSSGVLVQLTAGSLCGDYGRGAKRCAFTLLEMGAVSVVASDAHDPNATLPGEVADVVRDVVGDHEARRILNENPRLILQGKPVLPSGNSVATSRTWRMSLRAWL